MALSVRVFNKTTQISYRLIWHIMTPSLNTAGNSSQICRDFQKKMKLFSLKRKDFFHFRIINHKNDLNRVPVSHLRRKFSNEAKNKLQIVFSYIQFLVLNDSKLLTGDAQIWGGNKSWWCHDVTMSRLPRQPDPPSDFLNIPGHYCPSSGPHFLFSNIRDSYLWHFHLLGEIMHYASSTLN